ncbi:putative duf567-domain-containing protein [Rosellinia necatrix]|uniref:Putative duf567-domain-containing protein n=1 Tax=Rosellinia necatrix TaxID=77044 RepID=A0A1S7UMR0_ROSNE|nr:putative duf567-domain-containing protein [Rosellinia necatrix]
MDMQLQSPSPPVNMLGGHVSQQETILTLRCHDSTFKKVTVVDAEENPVFRVEGSTFGTSWSWRRKVYDAANNQHLFDFRHESFDFKNRWLAEDAAGRKVCSLVHKNQVTTNHSAIDATVRTVAGEDVLVIMRPQDGGALTTTVSVGGTTIATIRKAVDNTKTSRGDDDNSVWELRVAAATDLTMIMALALCRAEMGHVWKQ